MVKTVEFEWNSQIWKARYNDELGHPYIEVYQDNSNQPVARVGVDRKLNDEEIISITKDILELLQSFASITPPDVPDVSDILREPLDVEIEIQ